MKTRLNSLVWRVIMESHIFEHFMEPILVMLCTTMSVFRQLWTGRLELWHICPRNLMLRYVF